MTSGENMLRTRIEIEIRRQSEALSAGQPGGSTWRQARSTMAVLADIRGHQQGDCYVRPGQTCFGDNGKACRVCGQIVRVQTATTAR